MADTAKRLAGPAQVSNSAATKYTVPSSTTTIIRNIHIFNGSDSAATFTMSIGTDGAATRLYDAVSIPARGSLDWSGFMVMAATEIIQALSGTNNVLTLTISGVEVA